MVVGRQETKVDGTYPTGVDLDAVQVVTAADLPAATVVNLHGDIDWEVAEPLWDCVSTGSDAAATS